MIEGGGTIAGDDWHGGPTERPGRTDHEPLTGALGGSGVEAPGQRLNHRDVLSIAVIAPTPTKSVLTVIAIGIDWLSVKDLTVMGTANATRPMIPTSVRIMTCPNYPFDCTPVEAPNPLAVLIANHWTALVRRYGADAMLEESANTLSAPLPWRGLFFASRNEAYSGVRRVYGRHEG